QVPTDFAAARHHSLVPSFPESASPSREGLLVAADTTCCPRRPCCVAIVRTRWLVRPMRGAIPSNCATGSVRQQRVEPVRFPSRRIELCPATRLFVDVHRLALRRRRKT